MYPRCCRASGRACDHATPATRALPPCGSATPTRHRSSVDLPAPSGPTRPSSSPPSSARSTPSSATVAPKRLRSCSASSSAFTGHPPPAAWPVSIGRPRRGTPARPVRKPLARGLARSSLGPRDRDLPGHPRAQVALGVRDVDVDRVDEPVAVLARLHVARRELRLGGDPPHRALEHLRAVRVDLQLRLHPGLHAPELRVGQEER